MISKESIELFTAENKKGVFLPLQVYEAIKKAIIKSIEKSPQRALPLHVLIENVTMDLKTSPWRIVPWHILQVKIDLQERGIVNLYFNRDKMQVVEMARKNLRRHFFRNTPHKNST